MTIYIARHGQTEWNERNLIIGRTDLSLTDEGRQQAAELAKLVRGTDISKIISSPLKRALNTAQIVGAKCHIPIETDSRLIELDYGDYEGTGKLQPDFINYRRNPACRYPHGESQFQAAVRVYALLDDIVTRYPDESVLLVTHNGICRIIATYFRNMTCEDLYNYSLNNCELERYETNPT